VALTEEGEVWTWGANDLWELGRDGPVEEPGKVSLPVPIVDFCCGYQHVLVLSKNGEVFAWGQNDDGKVGIGHFTDSQKPVKLNFNEKISKIITGAHHSVAITYDGALYTWGWNKQGAVGTVYEQNSETPEPEDPGDSKTGVLQKTEDLPKKWDPASVWNKLPEEEYRSLRD
jgi:alpha-tubulin suppressor-like RCC1 family protein